MRNKNQHTVPDCYLKSWCDPNTPEAYEPYLWIISKDGSKQRRKSPRKTFRESDFYTIHLLDGTRDLIVEDTLSHFEGRFTELMKRKVKALLSLDKKDKALLSTFVALMYARTVGSKLNLQNPLKQLSEMTKSLERQFGKKPALSSEIDQVHQHATHLLISTTLEWMPQALYEMPFSIFVANNNYSFISSDKPCVLFNPELCKAHPFLRNPSLLQKDLEVSLPLTPKHMLVASWKNYPAYIEATEAVIDRANRRTRAFAHQEFISWTAETKPIWFELANLDNENSESE